MQRKETSRVSKTESLHTYLFLGLTLVYLFWIQCSPPCRAKAEGCWSQQIWSEMSAQKDKQRKQIDGAGDAPTVKTHRGIWSLRMHVMWISSESRLLSAGITTVNYHVTTVVHHITTVVCRTGMYWSWYKITSKWMATGHWSQRQHLAIVCSRQSTLNLICLRRQGRCSHHTGIVSLLLSNVVTTVNYCITTVVWWMTTVVCRLRLLMVKLFVDQCVKNEVYLKEMMTHIAGKYGFAYPGQPGPFSMQQYAMYVFTTVN